MHTETTFTVFKFTSVYSGQTRLQPNYGNKIRFSFGRTVENKHELSFDRGSTIIRPVIPNCRIIKGKTVIKLLLKICAILNIQKL